MQEGKPETAVDIESAQGLAQLLYALSDPTRLRIVQILDAAKEELRCGDFYEALAVSKPTLSHHFAVLRECGVMATRVDGTKKFNSLARKEIERRFPGILKSILQALRE